MVLVLSKLIDSTAEIQGPGGILALLSSLLPFMSTTLLLFLLNTCEKHIVAQLVSAALWAESGSNVSQNASLSLKLFRNCAYSYQWSVK